MAPYYAQECGAEPGPNHKSPSLDRIVGSAYAADSSCCKEWLMFRCLGAWHWSWLWPLLRRQPLQNGVGARVFRIQLRRRPHALDSRSIHKWTSFDQSIGLHQRPRSNRHRQKYVIQRQR